VEDLSHRVGAWPPTSQSAGNATNDNTAAMTAPGSASEAAPEPQPWAGLEIPAARPPTVLVDGHQAPDPVPWTQADGTPWARSADQEYLPRMQLRRGEWNEI
jgi:hypothetical protein